MRSTMQSLPTRHQIITFFAALVTSVGCIESAEALTLPNLIQAASEQHPTIQAARQSVNAANKDIDAARRQYWPTPSAVLESGASNTLQTSTQLLRVEQTVWDFGFTKANVNISERGAGVATAALNAQIQTICLQVIEAWGTLLSNHGRIQVAEATLKRLQLHESMMLRRVSGELSTQIDLELVRSRILQSQVELTQAKTGVSVSLTRLQNLVGMADLEARLTSPPPMPSRAHLDQQFEKLGQTDWEQAATHQPSVLRAEEELRQGRERINAKTAQTRPQIYARLDQSVNGRRDSAIYLGLRYSPGAGFATFAEESALAARALALEQSVNAAKIEARQLLDLDRDSVRDAMLRARSLDSALQGAQRVFESYERQFPAGRKTWIDLLNAVREVAQNAYSLADANASQATALYRLQLRVDPASVGTAPDDTGTAFSSNAAEVDNRIRMEASAGHGALPVLVQSAQSPIPDENPSR